MLKEFEPQISVEREAVLHAIQDLRSVCRFDLNQEFEPPSPWKTLMMLPWEKQIAAAPELGICVKRYWTQPKAQLVHRNYSLIQDTIRETQFPLIMPLDFYQPQLPGILQEALVFPFIEHTISFELDPTDMSEKFRDILKRSYIKTTLPLAHSLTMLVMDDDQQVFIDPFDDSHFQFFKRGM